MAKLTSKALIAINRPRPRTRLALELGCTEQTIRVYIKDNSDNLTKVSAMKVIREETGLTDSEILVEETIGEVTKEQQS
jgi:predicted transcriptional regulator